ncbi:MAG: nitrous oxide reductase accessory protein NosL [Dehalococcoidia bacterium]|nr:nitrous oxide reductase accessory protein NosL [Dehalococcoidia bacterium]
MNRRQFLIGLGSAAVLAAGVATGLRVLPDAEVGALPTIRYGQESCSFCGMSIDDPRFASAWRAADGERHFDDIGCMVNAMRRDHPAGTIDFYVHDYTSEQWLSATEATFAVSPTVKTPMAYGVLAAADASTVNDVAGSSRSVYTWSELLEHLERRS